MKVNDITITNTIKLMACAVNEEALPSFSVEDLRRIDYSELFAFCNSQSISATIAVGIAKIAKHHGIALSSLDGYKEFDSVRYGIILKEARFDRERTAILTTLDEAGIWYLPLKGIVLNKLYPQAGMRFMADNDILFDNRRAAEVREIFEKRGYSVESYGVGHHDTYTKPPFFNFEMHTFLGEDGLEADAFNEYYRDPSRLMIKDTGTNCGYHMSDEDFYIYMLAHAFKHYNYAGLGLRIIADTYVYLQHYRATMDWTYIERECQTIGMSKFAETIESLATGLMENGPDCDLSANEQKMLQVLCASATYGTGAVKKHLRLKKAEKNTGTFDGTLDLNEAVTRLGKLKYLWQRAFPKKRWLAQTYPLAQHWWGVPLVHIYRFAFRGTVLLVKLVKRCTRGQS